MTLKRNQHGQPVGCDLVDWSPPPQPLREPMEGRTCRLEPLNPDAHAAALYEVTRLDKAGRNWTYLPYGPFETLSAYEKWLEASAQTKDPLFFAILRKSDVVEAVGVASYLRIAPEMGSIEVGHIHYSERLKKSPVATEAMYLMMKHIFELGYRRYEWKCDSLNGPSRVAAQRLGFTYEGIFRQAMVYKGRSRDTAWYAAIDTEWPALQRAFSAWLAPENFDKAGTQQSRLSELTRPITQAAADNAVRC